MGDEEQRPETGQAGRPDEPGTTTPEPPPAELAGPEPDYDAAGVPSLDYVRERIEGRYATSLGATELAGESPEARTLSEQLEKRDEAARERLEEIRRSVQADPPAS